MHIFMNILYEKKVKQIQVHRLLSLMLLKVYEISLTTGNFQTSKCNLQNLNSHGKFFELKSNIFLSPLFFASHILNEFWILVAR